MELYETEKDIKIAYELTGNPEGNRMVLLHGLFLNADCWKAQLPAFKDDFHILKLDLRGHGRSTKPKGRFTIRNYIDDIYKLLKHLNWTSDLYLVGHSLGGMIALTFAVEHPDFVKKIVAADSFCHVTQDAITDVMGRIAQYPLEDFAKGISVRGLKPYDEEIALYLAKLVTDHMTKDDCLKATAASSGFFICKAITKLNIPTLLVVGEKDITTPVWASYMLHEWLPNSKIIIIPNSGHLTINDHPKRINELVKSFWENPENLN
jgi:3-oxoadipate enol-lactonase